MLSLLEKLHKNKEKEKKEEGMVRERKNTGIKIEALHNNTMTYSSSSPK